MSDSDLDKKFHEAAEFIKTWKPKKESSNDEKLCVYANYKQATVGDCNTSCPGMFDWTGRQKWNAWNNMKGKSAEQAKQDYVNEIERQKTVLDA